MNRMTAARALETLREGNKRFVSGSLENPRRDPARRADIAGGQHPFAAIVACSDSRVSPEIIFDQGLGDLFVVRAAGNLLDAVGLASIEYAVEHLRVPIVLVMGHSCCGAAGAAVEHDMTEGRPSRIVSALAPAVERARGLEGNLADNVSRENVRVIIARLKSAEPVLKNLVESGRLTIDGAFHDLESGVVALLD
jgi:carbonic anhydrase